jgi:hypothetical protein
MRAWKIAFDIQKHEKYALQAQINIGLRADDTNKKIDAWIDIYFWTYFHSKLYK